MYSPPLASLSLTPLLLFLPSVLAAPTTTVASDGSNVGCFVSVVNFLPPSCYFADSSNALSIATSNDVWYQINATSGDDANTVCPNDISKPSVVPKDGDGNFVWKVGNCSTGWTTNIIFPPLANGLYGSPSVQLIGPNGVDVAISASSLRTWPELEVGKDNVTFVDSTDKGCGALDSDGYNMGVWYATGNVGCAQ